MGLAELIGAILVMLGRKRDKATEAEEGGREEGRDAAPGYSCLNGIEVG